jgi:abequosyltransferase
MPRAVYNDSSDDNDPAGNTGFTASLRRGGPGIVTMLSVCIPAYNRPQEISLLLDSILNQDYEDFEVIVSDDNSPKAAEIARVVREHARKHPARRIRYSRNERNLGFDRHLREILRQAEGRYCVYMGDDDLLAPGALRKIDRAVTGNENIGVVLRSWASVDRATEQVTHTFKYFDSDRFFPAGVDTIVTFFRRSLFISGIVVHREAAIQAATDQFDGTLLYQLHLVANLLARMNGFYIADVLALNRTSGVHFFGTSEKEKDRFAPGMLLPDHSLNFVKGMLEVARGAEQRTGIRVYDRILRDIGNYSYTILRCQTGNLRGYLGYACGLAKLGLWKNPLFALFFLSLLCLGPGLNDWIIKRVKQNLGHTPVIGRLYTGEKSQS